MLGAGHQHQTIARREEIGNVTDLPYHRHVRLPRLSPRAYQRITLLALLALVFIIVTGAAVRLTGSGLGCSDWPTCESNRIIAPAEYHAMIEFINRTITGLVSVVVIIAVLGSLVRTPRRRDLTWLSLGLVAGVIGQIVLGGLTVLFELRPPFVIAHFVLSILLVWNAFVLHHRAGHDGRPGLPLVPPRIRRLGRALVVLASIAVLTGTVVTGTGPHGGDEKVSRLSFDITSVARIHSEVVWLFLIVAVATLVLLRRNGTAEIVDRRAKLLVAAVVVQGAIGYTQYFTGVPPLLVLLHVAGSIVVWLAALAFDLDLTAHSVERTDEPVPVS
jgi:cytochrome c oxidase assembly protein subunit 15